MSCAIVLCSGGLDSVVLAYYLKKIKDFKELLLVFINYDQNSCDSEIFCVKKACKDLGADLKIINLDWLGRISTSLINKDVSSGIKDSEVNGDLLNWYVPCRNSLFLLIALSIAESEFISNNKKYDIYLGIKFEGELQFKDTTPEFLKQMNVTAKFCTQKGVFKFIAPFLNKDKEELIDLAKKLNIPLQYTCSCYVGKGFKEFNNKKVPIHCGVCAGCKSRKKAFKFSNNEDVSFYLS